MAWLVAGPRSILFEIAKWILTWHKKLTNRYKSFWLCPKWNMIHFPIFPENWHRESKQENSFTSKLLYVPQVKKGENTMQYGMSYAKLILHITVYIFMDSKCFGILSPSSVVACIWDHKAVKSYVGKPCSMASMISCILPDDEEQRTKQTLGEAGNA